MVMDVELVLTRWRYDVDGAGLCYSECFVTRIGLMALRAESYNMECTISLLWWLHIVT
jgi:hypothetical protein